MINEPMVSDPIEILLVEDNEDDIVLIEEAFTEAKLMNVIFKVGTAKERWPTYGKKDHMPICGGQDWCCWISICRGRTALKSSKL